MQIRILLTSMALLLSACGGAEESENTPPVTDDFEKEKDLGMTEASQAVSLPKRIAVMSGHAKAGLSIHDEGQLDMATRHLLSAINEAYRVYQEELDAIGFDARPFQNLSAALENTRSAEEMKTLLQACEAHLQFLADNTGGDQVAIIRYLMGQVAVQYAAGVQHGQLVDASAYHAAIGFMQVALDRVDGLPAARQEMVQRELEKLLDYWPEATAQPAQPMPVGTVESQVALILSMLGVE